MLVSCFFFFFSSSKTWYCFSALCQGSFTAETAAQFKASDQRWVSGREYYTNCSYWVHLTKASCWAGNVEELPKHPGPISSLLFNGFTPIPYDGVYCSTHTPLPASLGFKHTSHSRGKESERERIREEATGKNKHKSKRATRITLYRVLRKKSRVLKKE